MLNAPKLAYGGAFATIIATPAYGQTTFGPPVSRQAPQAPTFEVDPFWPQPRPKQWLPRSAIGVAVDSKNHIFFIGRDAPTRNARSEVDTNKSKPVGDPCSSALPIPEGDEAGNLIYSWGSPGTDSAGPTRIT